jgi:hypothetical protein
LTAKSHELTRINDVVWVGWELSRHHNRMISFVGQKVELRQSVTRRLLSGPIVFQRLKSPMIRCPCDPAKHICGGKEKM